MINCKRRKLLTAAALLSATTALQAADQTIAIVGAMDVEIEKLIPQIEQRQTTTLRGHTYYTGTLKGHKIVLTRSGIGKVNAAVTTTELINEFDVNSVIFTGIAGAVHPDLEPADVVIGTSLVQHDVDLTAFGMDEGHMSGFDSRLFPADPTLVANATTAATAVAGKERVHQGIIATGDQFVANKDDVKDIYQEFNAMALEMEGAAVAQVASLYQTPFVVIRTISDKADGSAHSDYEKMKAVTAHHSANITLKMLESMQKSS